MTLERNVVSVPEIQSNLNNFIQDKLLDLFLECQILDIMSWQPYILKLNTN